MRQANEVHSILLTLLCWYFFRFPPKIMRKIFADYQSWREKHAYMESTSHLLCLLICTWITSLPNASILNQIMGGRSKQIITLKEFDSAVVEYMCNDKSSCFNSHRLTLFDLRSCQTLQNVLTTCLFPSFFLLALWALSILWNPFRRYFTVYKNICFRSRHVVNIVS